MKRILILLTAGLLLLAGCGARGQVTDAGAVTTAGNASKEIWTTDETPVSVRYDRMWFSSDSAEITDPAVIGGLVEAVRALKTAGPTAAGADDHTDILTFRFADGGMLRLEFEDRIWVTGDGARLQVEGMDRLRSLLDEVLPARGE